MSRVIMFTVYMLREDSHSDPFIPYALFTWSSFIQAFDLISAGKGSAYVYLYLRYV